MPVNTSIVNLPTFSTGLTSTLDLTSEDPVRLETFLHVLEGVEDAKEEKKEIVESKTHEVVLAVISTTQSQRLCLAEVAIKHIQSQSKEEEIKDFTSREEIVNIFFYVIQPTQDSEGQCKYKARFLRNVPQKEFKDPRFIKFMSRVINAHDKGSAKDCFQLGMIYAKAIYNQQNPGAVPYPEGKWGYSENSSLNRAVMLEYLAKGNQKGHAESTRLLNKYKDIIKIEAEDLEVRTIVQTSLHQTQNDLTPYQRRYLRRLDNPPRASWASPRPRVRVPREARRRPPSSNSCGCCGVVALISLIACAFFPDHGFLTGALIVTTVLSAAIFVVPMLPDPSRNDDD